MNFSGRSEFAQKDLAACSVFSPLALAFGVV